MTEKQEELIDFIKNYEKKRGVQPTYREMALHFNCHIKTISDRIFSLEKKGVIKRTRKSRCIQTGETLRQHILLFNFTAPNKSRKMLDNILAEALKDSETHCILFSLKKESNQRYPLGRVTEIDWKESKGIIFNEKGRLCLPEAMKKLPEMMTEEEKKHIKESKHIFFFSEVSSEMLMRDSEPFLFWEAGMLPVYQRLLASGTILEGKDFSFLCTYQREHLLSNLCMVIPRLFECHKELRVITEEGALILNEEAEEYVKDFYLNPSQA